jgi:hypothetical protein
MYSLAKVRLIRLLLVADTGQAMLPDQPLSVSGIVFWRDNKIIPGKMKLLPNTDTTRYDRQEFDAIVAFTGWLPSMGQHP